MGYLPLNLSKLFILGIVDTNLNKYLLIVMTFWKYEGHKETQVKWITPLEFVKIAFISLF